MPTRKAKGKQLVAPSPPARKELPRPERLAYFGSTSNGMHPTWRLSLLDLEHAGSWSWDVNAAALREITTFLSQMEKLTWTEIRAQMFNSKKGSHRKHHPMPPELLCVEAQRRLRALRLDDLDEMFRFRLGNKPRLWGVVDTDGVFYPVWWDPEHKVYPTEPG